VSAKTLDVLTVIHMGNYAKSGEIINDSCPCCNWEPQGDVLQIIRENSSSTGETPEWHLGMIWAPGAERGIGSYFQVIHCQKCGLVYATHIN